MDYKLLDEIVYDYINSIWNYISILTMNQIENLSFEVLNEDEPSIIKKDWSRKFNLNESMEIVYNFLMEISPELANQYINIIRQVDENNNPIVIFENDKNKGNNGFLSSDGLVHIHLSNTPMDMFLILHEILHKLNEYTYLFYDSKLEYLVNNTINKLPIFKNVEFGSKVDSQARNYFSEVVSITFELILGDYLVKNKIITSNDFDKIKLDIIKSAKKCAEITIIDVEIIKMKLNGESINYHNIKKQLSQCEETSAKYKVLSKELCSLKRLKRIIDKNRLDLYLSQRYVIAEYISKKILRRDNPIDDLLRLHYKISDIDFDIKDILNNVYTL